MILSILGILIGFVFLVKGADFLVDGGSNIAKKFHIPEIVIGMTIVSIGTSMPELMVSVDSALNGFSDISVGNVIGSNMANLFLILGVCAMIKNLPYKKQTKFIESGMAIFFTVLFLLFANNGEENIITRNEGFILTGFCILFIIYNIIMAKVGEKFDGVPDEVRTEKNDNISVLKSIFFIVIGCIGLKFGGDFVVNSAVKIAKTVGITEKLISLTIIAIGTSLPELVTSITATKKNDVDMAIGNIIGSGIFNILLIIGVSSILSPIKYATNYNNDLLLLLMGTVLFALFPFTGEKDHMTRTNGKAFFAIYVIYFMNTIYFGLV